LKGYPRSLSKLIEELAKFPGIGSKTAERLAFHVLKTPAEEAMGLALAIRDLKKNTCLCSTCCNIDETDPCWICSDTARDRSVICVVEQTRDLLALERSGSFNGLYHVLGGHISPLEKITPQNLTIDKLIDRMKSGGVSEVIIATNPNMDGDVTANHIAELLKPFGVKITRPARGLAPGSQVENVSQASLADAISGRQEMKP